MIRNSTKGIYNRYNLQYTTNMTRKLTVKSGSLRHVGLEAYLDARKYQHKDLGYVDFKNWIEADPPISMTNIAKKFGVSRSAVYNWYRQYEVELEKTAL